jgi:hypothetical protein
MPQIDRAYMAIALGLLIAGEMLGFYMGMKADTYWRSVHIAILLPGFVTMAVFAVIFRLWPTMKRGMLASVQFWLTVTGLAGIQIGGVQQTLNGSVLLLASGSGVMIAGTLLLGWLFYDRATA